MPPSIKLVYTAAYRIAAGTARAASTNTTLTTVASTTGRTFLNASVISFSLSFGFEKGGTFSAFRLSPKNRAYSNT